MHVDTFHRIHGGYVVSAERHRRYHVTIFYKSLVATFIVILFFSCPRAFAKDTSQHDVNNAVVQLKLADCESLSSLAESIAIERDKGVPLSDLYTRLPDSKFFPRAQNFKLAKFIYANSDHPPSDFKKTMLNDCYKRVKGPNG